MDVNNLQKSIALIGPSCVGKSLMAGELSKKLNYPVINIDDIITCVQMERDGNLSLDPEVQEAWVQACLEDIKCDEYLKENLINEKYIQAEIKLVRDYVDMFNYYHDLLGGFSQYYSIINAHDSFCNISKTPEENIFALNSVTILMLKEIFESLNVPLIIDPPASFGWDMNKTMFKPGAMKRMKQSQLEIEFVKEQQIVKDLLGNCQTICFVPGEDYKMRNSASAIDENNLILKQVENYYDNADVIISTNGVFNLQNNKFLKQRRWFDAREYLTKEELKNKAEISNICDQVIISLNELDQVK